MKSATPATLIGLDLNATRLRAVSGEANAPPHVLPLDGAHAELPAAISLEGRTPQIGRATLAQCRKLPHLTCVSFLAEIGTPRVWTAGRRKLDGIGAVGVLFDKLRPICAGRQGLVFAMPPYLTHPQIVQLMAQAARVKLPLLGTVPSALALALTAHAEQAWDGLAFVADVDDHALTWSAVYAGQGQLQVIGAQSFPLIGLRAWRERVLNMVADRCVRLSRRDPRDSAAAEQMLYEQLDHALDACRRGQLAELVVQSTTWCQNLVLRPEELAGWCSGFLRQAIDGMRPVHEVPQVYEHPSVVVLSDSAASLPGLVGALEERLGMPVALDDLDNPGSEPEDTASATLITVLSADAAARAVHALAPRFLQRDLLPGHHDAAPLPAPQPLDAGPARLHFRGQDYVVRGPTFTLGRQAGCNIVFDGTLYPDVALKHCEIVWEKRGFVLRDKSKNGTLVNDRPVIQQIALQAGDWIRLGPGGPVLRFLGSHAETRIRITTA
jgi:hypothetical protein